MSQRDVERTVGRVLTDAGFRRDFYRNPACLTLGVRLAPRAQGAVFECYADDD